MAKPLHYTSSQQESAWLLVAQPQLLPRGASECEHATGAWSHPAGKGLDSELPRTEGSQSISVLALRALPICREHKATAAGGTACACTRVCLCASLCVRRGRKTRQITEFLPACSPLTTRYRCLLYQPLGPLWKQVA